MKMIITPVYSDIFEGETPTLYSLISDIPSETIISILCMINAKLYSGKNTHDVQIEIFNFLTSRQTAKLKSQILNKVFRKVERNNNEPIQFFAVSYCLEFIHLELVNYRDFNINDTTPEQELNFVKAYFLIVEEVNKAYCEAFETNDKLEGDFFRKITWPTLISQVEANHNVSYIPGMIKAIALFNFLEYHSPYSVYVKTFLKIQKKSSSWNYVLDLINLLNTSWKRYRDKKTFFFPISFKEMEGYETLFDQFTLVVSEYKNQFGVNKNNYTGLKEKPIFFSKSTNARLVINWNFITNKIYDGLLFDFYKYSGIEKVQKLNKFIKFKEYISSELIEKFIFRRLISKYLEDKHTVLLFDEEDGFPDCYCRKNKTIFLIEIKDAYFPSKSIDSLSYTSIKYVIDSKYNNQKKGTGQLIKYIEKIKNSPYTSDDFLKKQIRNRNVIVYPVLVYTDKFFCMPSINNYLKEEFEKKVVENDLSKHFKSIKPLTFIDMNFLIDFVDKAGEIKIDTLIDSYNKELAKRNKRFDRFHEMDHSFAINDNFETVSFETFNSIFKNRNNYISIIIETLNLTEGLPKN